MIITKTVLCNALKTRPHYINIIGIVEYSNEGKNNNLFHICSSMHSPPEFLVLSFNYKNEMTEISRCKNKSKSWEFFLKHSQSVTTNAQIYCEIK